jgi:peptide/nickel transport system substrate-binding protein
MDIGRDRQPVKTVVIQGIDEWSTRRAMLERGDADRIDCS